MRPPEPIRAAEVLDSLDAQAVPKLLRVRSARNTGQIERVRINGN